MGVTGALVDGVTGFFTGLGVIFAVVLAAISWPVVTATTKWLLLAVILSVVANDVILVDREYDWSAALGGMIGSALIMGVSS